MSLTAHILFATPTQLPVGKERIHKMGGKWADGAEGGSRAASYGHVSAASIERVFIAVKAGLRTTREIARAMMMSDTVVQRALIALEDWPTGPRVKRIKAFPAHQFEVME